MCILGQMWYWIVSNPDPCTLTYFVFDMLLRIFIATLWSSAGKGLTSWLVFVMLNCVFSLYHVVSWVRCGTWLYRYLIFAAFLTLNVAALYVCFAFPFPSLFAHVRIVHTSHKSFRANVCTWNNLTHIDSTRGLRYLHTTNNWPQANLVQMYALTNYWSR